MMSIEYKYNRMYSRVIISFWILGHSVMLFQQKVSLSLSIKVATFS